MQARDVQRISCAEVSDERYLHVIRGSDLREVSSSQTCVDANSFHDSSSGCLLGMNIDPNLQPIGTTRDLRAGESKWLLGECRKVLNDLEMEQDVMHSVFQSKKLPRDVYGPHRVDVCEIFVGTMPFTLRWGQF